MDKIQRMYSYVVEHDCGISPNPYDGFCTLAFCKFSEDGRRRNVVEMAEVGDWIVGTGGESKLSAGHGRLVYAMLVTEKMKLQDYFVDPRFKHRAGNKEQFTKRTDRFALVSNHYYYFGRNAPRFEERHVGKIEKRGSGYKSTSLKLDFITDFVKWLEENFTPGIHGPPCAVCGQESYTTMRTLNKCPARRRLKMR